MRPSRSQTQPFARHWPSGRPSVTALLLALSVAAATGEWLMFVFDGSGELFPERMLSAFALQGTALSSGHWWQFVTFTLLHPNPFHLLANMLVLWFAGREVEPIVGMRHFAMLYVTGNLLGGLAQWGAIATGLAPATMMLTGVSAGVAAVLAAYATILPEMEVVLLLFFVLPVRVRAKTLGVCLLFGAIALWIAQSGSTVGPAAILAGTICGWAWAKQLGFGNPLALERYLFDRRQHAARIDRMPAEQFIREELDPILEKIARQGKRSLTRGERRLLEKGREKLAAREVSGGSKG